MIGPTIGARALIITKCIITLRRRGNSVLTGAGDRRRRMDAGSTIPVGIIVMTGPVRRPLRRGPIIRRVIAIS